MFLTVCDILFQSGIVKTRADISFVLQELPVPTPVKTRLPPEIFGDAVMVLEFLHAFGELFDLQDEFPDGVTLGKFFFLGFCFELRNVLCF